MILNDLIIGLAFRQFLCQNRDTLNAMLADGLEVRGSRYMNFYPYVLIIMG